jgi:hypothetical protein
MIRNFIIGASLVALGVIVAGSLESARIASPQFAATEEDTARSTRSRPPSKSGGSAILCSRKQEPLCGLSHGSQ